MLGLDNPIHILFLLVIALLLFGAKRLPEMGRSLGEGLRGFKDSVSGDSHDSPLSHMTSDAQPRACRRLPAATPLPTTEPVRERVSPEWAARRHAGSTSVTPLACRVGLLVSDRRTSDDADARRVRADRASPVTTTSV